MKETNAVILARLDQKLDDLINRVERFDTKIKEISGKVDCANLKIMEVETSHENCQARVNYNADRDRTQRWIIWIPSLIAVVVSILSLVLR